MTVYIDTSIVLRVLLDQPNQSTYWGKWKSAYINELVRTEFYRTIDRLRLQAQLTDEERSLLSQSFEKLRSTCYQIPLDKKILKRAAEPFPTVVGTLGALHLSSAILLNEMHGLEVKMLTHDHQLTQAAVASGLQVLP